ncbi:Nuclear fragile X mental retardation-interacting protein 1 [Lamellibrachia satsuma]|nr:Nuclear fragile X mental retardation-interacting protein 1 [Lamellibrachia satsuma]
MYQSPRYGCRPPLQDPPGVPSGYRGFPPGPPPPMSCWHAGRGPYWRPNIPPPGPGMRMQWPPSGPGPCGYGPPPGHQMTGPPPPPGYQMSNQPPLPQFPGHNFHGAVKRRHPGSDMQPQKKKKPHMDKRELAENNVFFCDTCDRGFKTEDKYHEHVMGHEQCSVAGCPFVAAPKLVALHYNLQHRSGFAKQIWKLESKEDVANWIESRKRNYPTASNIAKKQADLQARQDRGEVLHTKQFGSVS